jgi:hypothetical protein
VSPLVRPGRIQWYWLLLQLAAVATGIWAGVGLFDVVTT